MLLVTNEVGMGIVPDDALARLAMTLLDASVKVLLEMATFESAGVSDSGP